MRTINTYSKGAPFYNASAHRNVGPADEKTVYQGLGLLTGNGRASEVAEHVGW